MKNSSQSLLLSLFLFVSVFTIQAQTYVDINATGANDGSSWVNAYSDLQPALDNAVVGNEIWVAAGTYLPTEAPDGAPTGNNRLFAFHLANKDIKIYGGFNGTETLLTERDFTANLTILSGDFNNDDVVTGGGATLTFANNGENAHHVFVSVSLTAGAVLDGFSVLGGRAEINSSYSYAGQSVNNRRGAGMYNNISSPTLANVTFLGNNASFDGGGMNNEDSSPTLTNVTFSQNNGEFGGGMYNNLSSPTLTNVLFYGNTSSNQKDIFNDSSNPSLSFTAVEDYAGTCTNCITLTTTPFTDPANPNGADGIPRTVDDGLALLAGSPPVGAGTATGAPTIDITGATRPTPPSMGAYEEVVAIANIIVNATTGDLEFIDINDRHDDLTIVINGANYRLTDPINPLTAGAGATQIDANTVDIPIASVTGDITINTNGGDDTLTLDFSGGNFTDIINYDGGNQNSTNPGDILTLQGGGTFATVGHLLTNESDGSVGITGNNFINYVGLEPVIDNLNAVDREFTFTGAAETITLQNDTTLGFNNIDSTMAESVTFTNPTNSLTINTEFFSIPGTDIINIQGLDAAFDADLTVNAGADDDVNFQTNPTAIGTGDYNINGRTISCGQGATTTGLGTITFNAVQNIELALSSPISAENGNITINANNTGTLTGVDTNAIGILNGTVTTTGSGNIIFNGIATSTGATSFNNGVDLGATGATQIISTGSGAISINGTGGNGINENAGIVVNGTVTVRTTGGGITFNGIGGNGTGLSNLGTYISINSTVEDLAGGDITVNGSGSGTGADRNFGIIMDGGLTTTTGDITLTGQGSSTSTGINNEGIWLVGNGVNIETQDGVITLNGTSGAGTNENDGIQMEAGAVVQSTGMGSIVLDGTATSGVDNNNGINIANTGSLIRAAGGTIDVTGQGAISGTAVNNRGVLLSDGAKIENIGTGAVNITGTGGAGTFSAKGVEFLDVDTAVTTVNGGITINGTSGMASDGNNAGISIRTGAQIQATGTGFITMDGTSTQSTDFGDGINIIGPTTAINANGGAITLTGQAAQVTTGQLNYGVEIANSALIENTGTGTIAITGTGGDGTIENTGLEVFNATIRTNNGSLSLSGTSGIGTGIDNRGIALAASTIVATGTGTVGLNGTSAGSSGSGQGIYNNASMIQATGGGILITGQGANSATGTGQHGIRLDSNATLTDTNGGIITVNGTSGNGSGNNQGVNLSTTTITATTGDVLVTGTSTSIGILGTGIIFFNGSSLNTGTGNIQAIGTSTNVANSAIFLFDVASSINAGGTTTLSAITGPLNTPDGIPPSSPIQGSFVTINGEVQPGSPLGAGIAQLPINGNTALSAGDILTINISAETTAGTDYDQLAVTGTLDITDATLTLVDNVAGALTIGAILTIIDNDGSDAIIGNFNGLAEGAVIPFNGQTFTISYAGGDGNDVVLTAVLAPNILVSGSGDLIFTDIDDRDDDLTIVINGANYRLTDPINPLTAGAGATQIDASTVDVPMASVTGDITINTAGGDDSLTTDFSGGNFNNTLNYDGGAQNNTNPGDILTLQGGGTFAAVEHTFISESDGSVAVAGNPLISYVGLEPIIDNLDVTDRIFSYTGISETITLQNEATAGSNIIDSTLGESVTFTNPTNSLTINTEASGGSGVDELRIEGLDVAFDADLTVNSGADDTVDFVTNPTDIGSGNYDINAKTINVNAAVSTTGAGMVTVTAIQNIIVNATGSLNTLDGAITLNANATNAFAGANTDAIFIDDGDIITTGSGNINMTGIAFGDGTGSNHFGIQVQNNSLIRCLDSGNININGTGGAGINQNQGIRIEGAGTQVTTLNGTLTLNGTSGNGSGNNNEGTLLLFATVQATGTGSIAIIGTAGNGTDNNKGVVMFGAGTLISANGGGISIIGQGAGTGNGNHGISLEAGTLIENLASGAIILQGTGGPGINQNQGVRIQDAGTQITTLNGPITLNGTGGNGSGSNNEGVTIIADALIQSTGTGTINIIGNATGGIDQNKGIVFFNADAITANGGITMLGNASGTGDRNYGISIEGGSNIEDTTNGNISLTGVGGDGTDNNSGVQISDADSNITAVNGDITITGTSGAGSSFLNNGVNLAFGPKVEVTGTSGAIAITGTSVGIDVAEIGIRLFGATLKTNGGGIQLMGQGSLSGVFDPMVSGQNNGVDIRSNALLEDLNNGAILINGIGGQGSSGNSGIQIESTSTLRTDGGGITLNGQGGGNTVSNMGIRCSASTIQDLSTGNLIFNGTSGNGITENVGVFVRSTSVIESNGGAIEFSGQGLGSDNFNFGVYLSSNSTVTGFNNSAITINGIGGNGIFGNYGAYIANGATVQTNGAGIIVLGEGNGNGDTNYGINVSNGGVLQESGNGTISVDGTGSNGPGADNTGVFLGELSTLLAPGAGTILIEGIAGNTNSNAIDLEGFNSMITAGTLATLTGNGGPIVTPAGIPPTDLIQGNTITFNGTLQTGSEVVGLLPVNGNTQLSAGDILTINISEETTPGTDYDQIAVTGTVDISDATLNLVDTINVPISDTAEIILIDNDDTDTIIGNFNGLPDGATIPFNGQNLTINYAGGDGNDVVLTVIVVPNILVSGGDLLFTDNDDRDDNLTIVIDGTNYRFTDPDNVLNAGAGATQIDPNTVDVLITTVTGNIAINTAGGDDSFTTDFSGGNFTNLINYDGGLQNNTNPGDILRLQGGGMFATVEHSFINENEGSVAVAGNPLISYVGLEPINDNLSVTDRVFTYTGSDETITVQNEATAGSNIIDSTLGESVTFTNPTNSLSINTEVSGGSGVDIINIEGVDAAFDADLMVNAGVDDDANFLSSPTSIGTGNYTINARTITANANVTTAGTGTITFEANQDIFADGTISISAENGDITLNANAAGTLTSVNVTAIVLNNATVTTSGSGNIILSGVSPNDGTGDNRFGVGLFNNATLSATGTGDITVTGTGGDGTFANTGVEINNGRLNTNTGAILINGIAGNNTGDFNQGVAISNQSMIRSFADGSISIIGQGGTGTSINRGVEIQGTGVGILSNGGTITITGTTSATTTDIFNIGVSIRNEAEISTTASGGININGAGGGGTSSNFGLEITSTGTIVRAENGPINITCTGGNGLGVLNEGIRVFEALVQTTGTGTISMNGQGGSGTSGNYGLRYNDATISSNGGGLNITGQGGGTNDSNYGVVIENTSLLTDVLNGPIVITGTGGNGVNQNFGVLSQSSSIVESNGGGIEMTGTGVGTGNVNFGVYLSNNSIIRDLSTGNLSFDGIGGDGVDSNIGAYIDNDVLVQSNGGNINIIGQGVGSNFNNFGIGIVNNSTIEALNNGAITLNGVGANGADIENIGVWLDNPSTINAVGTGAITIEGTAGNALSSDIVFEGVGSRVLSGAALILTTNTGRITTPAGIPPASLMEGSNITINGDLRPGDRTPGPGQLPITGNTFLSSGDILTINIAGETTPGTDYDQVAVIGTVDISEATLTLVDDIAVPFTPTAELVLIANDGSDPVVGTFNGLPNNSIITFNDQTLTINYAGGDGNDISLVFGLPPTAICQDITVQLDDTGSITILPSQIDNGSSDPDGAVTLSLSEDTFTCADIGANTVTLIVTDNSGNEAMCTAIVTVEDMIAPIAVCQDLTVQLDDLGNATITADQLDGGSTDNCEIATLELDVTTFSCDDAGENTVTLTVTDTSGNMSTCTATVTVIGTDAPVAVCQNISVILDQNGLAVIDPSDIYSGPGAPCNLSIDINTITCDNVDNPVLVTLTATDSNGDETTCTALVNAIDTTVPVIICPDETVIIAALTPYELPNFGTNGTVQVIDSCADNVTFIQDPPVGTFVEEGETNITITAIDPSGNKATCEFTIFIDPSLSVDSQAALLNTISLYPNPASSFIVLENPNNLALNNAQLIDISGRTVKQFDLTRTSTERILDISEIASASYFLIVEGTEGSVTFQVIKR